MTDHVIEGLKRIGHQYAHAEKFWAWVTATLQPMNELESAFQQLLAIELPTAEGAALDLLGRIVGAPALILDAEALPLFGFDGQDNAQPFGETSNPAAGGHWRESDDTGASPVVLTEAMYRLAITAQILRNHSDCTPNEIIDIVGVLTSAPLAYVDGAMWIGIGMGAGGMSLLERRLIEVFLPRPAGVGLRFFSGWINGFGWADQPDSLGFGDTADAAVGGFWIEEIAA